MSIEEEYKGVAFSFRGLIKFVVMFASIFLVPEVLVIMTAVFAKLAPIDLIVVYLGSMSIMAGLVYAEYNRIGSKLHGKGTLLLTMRNGPGDRWYDFITVTSAMPISDETFFQKIMPKNITLASEAEIKKEAGDLKIVRGLLKKFVVIEYKFEGSKELQGMLLLSPCPPKEVLDFQPEQVLYNGMPVYAQGAPLDVVKLFEFSYEGNDGKKQRMPVCYPLGCDYTAKAIQTGAGIYGVTPADIRATILQYDSFKSVELKQRLITQEGVLNARNDTIEDVEDSADDRGNAIVDAYLKTRKHQTNFGVFKNWKFWLYLAAFLGAAVLVFFLVRSWIH